MSFGTKSSFIQDRFTQGFVAGLIGWFPQFIFMQPMHWLFHATKFQYLDFMAIIAYNNRPKGILQFIFSELLVVAVSAGTGAIFAMLVKVVSSRNLIFKGAMWAGSVWFILYTLVILYKIEKIYGKIDFPTAVINLIGALIFGSCMGWALLILNKKYGAEN